MWNAVVAPFTEYAFMRRALLGCIALSFCAPPIGVFLTLRRMSLMGDAMSHAVLPGVAIGYLLAGFSIVAMSAGGLVVGLVVVLASGVASRFAPFKEDTALAAFYLISLALGVILISSRGTAIDLMQVLFGTILSLDDVSLYLVTGVSTVSILGLALIFRPLVLECIDPLFLRVASKHSAMAHLVFLALVVFTLVGSFSALGTLLAVGIMVLPAATARYWSDDLTRLIAVGVICAIVSSISGLLMSYHSDMPPGPCIILVAGAIYLVSSLYAAARNRTAL